MFDDCYSLTSLNISSFDTSKVTNIRMMFNDCTSFTSLDLSNFNTSKVTDMDSMFFYCISLTSLNLSNFDTNSTIDIGSMFKYCKHLTSLDISSFDFSNTKYIKHIFAFCDSLSNLKFGKNLKISIDLSDCPLTYESVLSVIDGLAELETNELQNIWLSEETYDMLTAEDIKKATDKNWKIEINHNMNEDHGFSFVKWIVYLHK